MDAIETFTDEDTGIKAHVVYDDGGSDNPRDWDNVVLWLLGSLLWGVVNPAASDQAHRNAIELTTRNGGR